MNCSYGQISGFLDLTSTNATYLHWENSAIYSIPTATYYMTPNLNACLNLGVIGDMYMKFEEPITSKV